MNTVTEASKPQNQCLPDSPTVEQLGMKYVLGKFLETAEILLPARIK